ncbi:MAG: MATE family efflux transporter [Pseudomonadales bacterium]|nr:MATE family efflux transporter [Pseudomonadales bacterium]
MTTAARSAAKPDLVQDPVAQALFRTTVPTTIGAVAVILYYLANTFFVSLLGTNELAALGFTFPATILITYFGVGLGIGTSALVARALGCNNQDDAQRLTFASMALGLVIGVLLIPPAFWSINYLFPLLGAEPERLGLIRDFMDIWYLGMPLQLMQFSGTAVIRANGNATLHGKLMTISAIINAVLDPLLIFGFGPIPAMGIGGAALATVIAWAYTIVVICYTLAREHYLRLHLPPLRELIATWWELLRLSLPASLANMITPISTGVLTAALAVYGSHAVAAYGVASRIESFIMIVVLGMSMSVPPFISQNYGAGRHERVCEGLRLSLRFILAWQFALYVVVAITAPWIALLFTSDPEVRDIIVTILRILPASYSFQGMVVLSASSFNALHAPRNGLITSLTRFFVFYVPLALLGNHFYGITGLFVGAALGNLLAGLVIQRWIHRYTQGLLHAACA